MQILVVGSGGREHAICSAFNRSSLVTKLYCANGNAGIAEIAECVDVRPNDVQGLASFAAGTSIDLTFVGGETPLALGIVDEFNRHGLRIVGPTRTAARLESSKAFAKDFMARHCVPTARYATAASYGEAISILESSEFGNGLAPVVVKADGLAAGKGVVVAANRTEAKAAVIDLESTVGKEAVNKIVIEECLTGPEVSLIMFADGEHFALMPPTRDHKRIGEGDTGLNTGGMGTICDDSLLTVEQKEEIVRTMIEPTLKGCRDEGFPFRGILFLGLMMTAAGPKLLEYNVRFGDPEAQSILVRLDSDMIDICESILDGSLNTVDIRWNSNSSACVILASAGYPQNVRSGDVIEGIDDAAGTDGTTIFHAATARNSGGQFVTSGGRVLGVTATGDDINGALDRAYAAVGKINWNGMQFRRDIGRRITR